MTCFVQRGINKRGTSNSLKHMCALGFAYLLFLESQISTVDDSRYMNRLPLLSSLILNQALEIWGPWVNCRYVYQFGPDQQKNHAAEPSLYYWRAELWKKQLGFQTLRF